MSLFFQLLQNSLKSFSELDKDRINLIGASDYLVEVLKKYFRLEVQGLENVPDSGRVLITPNHSGFSGFDAVILANILREKRNQLPQVLTHHLWFANKTVGHIMENMGFVEAKLRTGNTCLQQDGMVVIFPEGEYGNFKPTLDRYHLQKFRRGFIRMALLNNCPIVPTLIIGAEETHINLARLKLRKFLPGAVLPLPLNIIPLPAKWKIIFLKPIHLPYGPESAKDRELVVDLASEVREEMQAVLSKEIASRDSIYF